MTSITPEGVVLGVHIAAGFAALFVGFVALVTRKGGDRHRLAGRIFVWSMAVVVGLVPVLLAFDPSDFARQFLTLVAVFSGYLVFSGYRVLSRKRPADEPEGVDWLGAGLVTVACLGLGGWGAVILAGGTQLGVVLIVFGAIGGSVVVGDVRAFLGASGDPQQWMVDHLSRMIGGYIATVTAISVVNLTGLLPAAVVWFWPSAVGVPLIFYWQATYADTGPLAGVVG